MRGRLQTLGIGASRGKVIALIAVALFALRALVPAGFMPDFASLRDGRFEVVLCADQGIRTAAVGADGQIDDAAKQGHSDKTYSGECAFGLFHGKSFLTAPLLVLVAPRLVAEAPVLPAKPAFLLPPAQGPPLGPRAPPSTLV